MAESTVGRRWRGARAAACAPLLAAGLVLGGCDLSVVNPATVEDESLEREGIIPTSLYQSLINGMRADIATATSGEAGPGGLFTAGALITDELVHAGETPSLRGFGAGGAEDDWQAVDELWAAASRARMVSDEGVARMLRGVGDPTDPENSRKVLYLTIGQVWAGYIHRIMGDNFCQAVIDGGPLQDHTEFYRRAEQYFTDAIATASASENQSAHAYIPDAHAGRAQVRMMLGDWEGAVADAREMETKDFLWVGHYSFFSRTRNYLHQLGRADAELTVWGTPFAEWGLNTSDETSTGDPRVAFEAMDDQPVGDDGVTPFLAQRKYLNGSVDMIVARGTEMRLIEAEAALLAGDWQSAVDKINEVREFRNSPAGGSMGLPLVVAANADDAWDLLMKERGVELWLQGRRLPDLRRWAQTPGRVPFEVVRQPGASAEGQNVLASASALCIPVSRYEKTSNPNI